MMYSQSSCLLDGLVALCGNLRSSAPQLHRPDRPGRGGEAKAGKGGDRRPSRNTRSGAAWPPPPPVLRAQDGGAHGGGAMPASAGMAASADTGEMESLQPQLPRARSEQRIVSETF